MEVNGHTGKAGSLGPCRSQARGLLSLSEGGLHVAHSQGGLPGGGGLLCFVEKMTRGSRKGYNEET